MDLLSKEALQLAGSFFSVRFKKLCVAFSNACAPSHQGKGQGFKASAKLDEKWIYCNKYLTKKLRRGSDWINWFIICLELQYTHDSTCKSVDTSSTHGSGIGAGASAAEIKNHILNEEKGIRTVWNVDSESKTGGARRIDASDRASFVCRCIRLCHVVETHFVIEVTCD